MTEGEKACFRMGVGFAVAGLTSGLSIAQTIVKSQEFIRLYGSLTPKEMEMMAQKFEQQRGTTR